MKLKVFKEGTLLITINDPGISRIVMADKVRTAMTHNKALIIMNKEHQSTIIIPYPLLIQCMVDIDGDVNKNNP